MKVTGVIESIGKKEVGTTKDDRGWSKISFLVKTSEEYNNEYSFDIFAMDDADNNKVENFIKFNKVGVNVDVEFNIKTSPEYKGKRYTSLDAWKVFKAEEAKGCVAEPVDESDDLPF